MKIYAIRDTLIDYYLQPFVGPDDKNVLAAIARTVNTQEATSDIAQAPHHFEIWKLGEIYEDGTINARQERITSCDKLIRRSLRGPPESEPRGGTPPEHTGGSESPPDRISGDAHSGDSTLQGSPPSEALKSFPVHPPTARGN